MTSTSNRLNLARTQGRKNSVHNNPAASRLCARYLLVSCWTMIFRTTILAVIIFLDVSCQTKQEETAMADRQPSSNPYYSRTDTSVLTIPNSAWKKVLSCRGVCRRPREGHRTGVHREILGLRRTWHVLLRCLRQQAFPVGREVCQHVRLAELF